VDTASEGRENQKELDYGPAARKARGWHPRGPCMGIFSPVCALLEFVVQSRPAKGSNSHICADNFNNSQPARSISKSSLRSLRFRLAGLPATLAVEPDLRLKPAQVWSKHWRPSSHAPPIPMLREAALAASSRQHFKIGEQPWNFFRPPGFRPSWPSS